MSTKNSKSVKSAEKNGVGRPVAKVVWPNGRFTMKQAYAANPHVCKLTVINHRVAALKGNDSVLVKLDELGKSETKGRKSFIYLRRSQRDAGRKASANLRKAASVTVPIVDTTPVADPVVTTPIVTETVTA